MTETEINKARLEALKQFFIDLYTGYPDIFLEKNREFYKAIISLLEANDQSDSFENYIEVQRLIFKNISNYKQVEWYKKFHSVYIYHARTSEFGRHCFSRALKQLLNNAGQAEFNKVFAPACGKLFEARCIQKLTNCQQLVAQDIDWQSLEFSRSFNHELSKEIQLTFEHRDLSQNTAEHAGHFDLAIFLQPEVVDFERFENSPAYRKAGHGTLIPPKQMKKLLTKEFIAKNWDKILRTSFNKLKQGGIGCFFFYEHRELEITLDWLKDIPGLAVIDTYKNDEIIDPAFAADVAENYGGSKEEATRMIAMGAYRAGLLFKRVGKASF